MCCLQSKVTIKQQVLWDFSVLALQAFQCSFLSLSIPDYFSILSFPHLLIFFPLCCCCLPTLSLNWSTSMARNWPCCQTPAFFPRTGEGGPQAWEMHGQSLYNVNKPVKWFKRAKPRKWLASSLCFRLAYFALVKYCLSSSWNLKLICLANLLMSTLSKYMRQHFISPNFH